MAIALRRRKIFQKIDRHNNKIRACVEGLLTGLACAITSAVILVVVRVSLIGAARRCLKEGKPASECLSSLSGSFTGNQPFSPVMAVIIGPILETLVFYAVFIALRPWRNRLSKSVYVSIMAFLGWFLHGASYLSINRMVAFTFLALLYVRWSKEGLWFAFIVTAWAHIVFNSSILVISSFAR